MRELAAEAGVNPNTMQRAITQLETLGLVTTNRTLGRTVTENAGALEEMRRRLAVECTENFFREMGALGYSRGEAADMAQAERKKNDEWKKLVKCSRLCRTLKQVQALRGG